MVPLMDPYGAAPLGLASDGVIGAGVFGGQAVERERRCTDDALLGYPRDGSLGNAANIRVPFTVGDVLERFVGRLRVPNWDSGDEGNSGVQLVLSFCLVHLPQLARVSTRETPSSGRAMIPSTGWPPTTCTNLAPVGIDLPSRSTSSWGRPWTPPRSAPSSL